MQDNKQKVITIANSIGMEDVSEETINELAEELDNEDLDKLSGIIKEGMTEDDRKYSSLPSVSGGEMSEEQRKSLEESKRDFESKDLEAVIVHDPVTGKRHLTSIEEKSDKNVVSIEDIANGKDPISTEEVPENAAEILSTLGENFQDDDIENMIELLKVFKEDGDQGPIFDKLPQTIKDQIFREIPVDKRTPVNLEIIAKQFIDYIKSEIKMEEAYIEFQDSIKKEMDVPDYLDLYNENIKEVMEDQMLEKANKLEYEGNIEHAQRLRKVSKYFTYSYTLDLLKNEIERVNSNGGNISTKLGAKTKKMTKVYNHFNREYATNKFNIRDIRSVPAILDRLLPEDISMKEIEKFVVLFITTTKGMQATASRIHEHTYMYYFVNNIVMLDDVEHIKTEFSQLILDNICELIRSMR